MDKNKCSSCGEAPHKCSCKNKEFTKAVIEINNPEQITLMRRVVIPASMGDDTTVPPAIGKYHNVLLYYEANHKSYLYSSDGIPTLLVNGVTDYEQAVNLPQINGVTLLGDKSAADLELADAPMVITVANDNTSWSGADTAEEVYNFFLNKGKVNIVFNGGENYAYEIDSAGYIPEEEKMMCTLTVATATTVEETVEFDGNALFGIMTLYTANKAIDVSQIELQPKLYIADFTGLDLNYNELSGVPATNASIGMVKPGDGLEVASDGTLSISDIEQYAHFFDTVADMKAATNLKGGDYAKTLGYYVKDDMGGAYYKISSTAPSGYYETLNSGLYAELVSQDTMNVRQFGAKGDGISDDTAILNQALSWCNGKNVANIIFSKGTYKITDSLTIYSNSIIEGCGKDTTIIKMDVSDDTETNHYIMDFTNKSNLIIKNITFSGIKPLDDYTLIETKLYFGLRLNNSNKILIDNCGFQQLYSSALSIRAASNITVSNSTFNHNGWNDVALTKTTDNIKIVNNTFEDVVSRGINAEDGNMDELVTNILISGNKIDSKSTSTDLCAISFGNTTLSGDGHRYQNIIISDNEINRTWIGISYKFTKNINITNNIITSGRGIANNSTNMTNYNRNINISNNTFIPNHPNTGNKYGVELVKNYNLIFNGNTILDSTAAAVTITQSNNITVNNNIIKNSGNNGLTLTSNTNVICNNNRIHDITNNGVYLASSNVTFMNNEILNTGADAVSLAGQNSKFRIEGNYIFNAGRYGVLFPSGSSGSKFAVLRNNYFGEDRETKVFTYGYVANVDVDYVVIENTYIYTSGLNLRGSSHWGTNCTFRNNEGFGALPA